MMRVENYPPTTIVHAGDQKIFKVSSFLKNDKDFFKGPFENGPWLWFIICNHQPNKFKVSYVASKY